MITQFSCGIPLKENTAKIGDLSYGSVVTNVPSGCDSIYLKVKTISCGQGMYIKKEANHSVLLNLKYGTLRQIAGGTVVEVLDCALDMVPATARNFMK